MKETTGVARMTRMAGESRRSAQGERKVRAASRPPSAVPSTMPARMRPRVAATVPQKAEVPASRTRAARTAAG